MSEDRRGLPRQEAHEVDTRAQAIVRASLPREWVPREMGGADYGIDLAVELFDAGAATGSYLFLQLKGTTEDLPDGEAVRFSDFPVKTLKYAELFEVPLLLAYCPVRAEPGRFRFIWLQEYIAVVLNHDNPAWRDQGTTTLLCPAENQMPTDEGRRRLEFAAGHPRRLHDYLQLGGIQHDLRTVVVALDPARIDRAHVEEARRLIERAGSLRGIFAEPMTSEAASVREDAIQPGLTSCDLLLSGRTPTEVDVEGLAWDKLPVDPSAGDPTRSVVRRLRWVPEQLSGVLSRDADPESARGAWVEHKYHHF